mmetsp:Transcript_41099/g.84071  ORF Transcript_41099/g.84071 Transcript_41099/m.84071 type:complete len:454 (-) Transcript_41099:360-1721(-)
MPSCNALSESSQPNGDIAILKTEHPEIHRGKSQDNVAQIPSSGPLHPEPPPAKSASVGSDSMPQGEELEKALEQAVKYVWNEEKADWETRRVQIIMEEKPYKEGGMRVAHKAWEFSGDKVVAGVAKYFKEREISSNMCFSEAMTQLLADEYAVRFNETLRGPRNVRFVPVSVLRLRERSGQIVSFEPFLGGKYVKHNDNDGHVDTDDFLPQAFSHFTWEASDRKLLVCDIQGVGDFYTDPQVHSADGEGFGTGNMGLGGIQKFFSTHRCNTVCRSLKLDDRQPFASWELEQESSVDEHSAHSSPLRGAASTPEDLANALERAFTQAGSGEGSSSPLSQARGRRRRGSEEGSSLGFRDSSGRRKSFSGGSKKIASIWSSGKKFGSALVSAVKNSIQSPTSSRSVSPVTSRARSGEEAAQASGPQRFVSNRRRRMSFEAGGGESPCAAALPTLGE